MKHTSQNTLHIVLDFTEELSARSIKQIVATPVTVQVIINNLVSGQHYTLLVRAASGRQIIATVNLTRTILQEQAGALLFADDADGPSALRVTSI